MISLKTFLNKSYLYLLALSIYIIILAILTSFFPKGVLELKFNANHTPVLDFIFKYATVLGEGSFYAVFVILLFVYRLGPAIHSLLTILISTVIVQTLKNTVFHQWPRPIKYLGENAGFHLVDGIDINFINTFPSGHTATGFCISGVIVVITLGFAKEGRNAIQVLAFLFALLVGLSRVYLMQHFFVDILFGAIVGSFSAFVSYFLLLKWSYYNNYCLADKSIIDFWKK